MLHAREDYNRIQDPLGKIAEDDPVFMVRAKDRMAPATMRYWADRHEGAGGDSTMSQTVRDHAELAEEWQRVNGSKIADL